VRLSGARRKACLNINVGGDLLVDLT